MALVNYVIYFFKVPELFSQTFNGPPKLFFLAPPLTVTKFSEGLNKDVNVPVSLAQLVGTMHNISNPDHHKKKTKMLISCFSLNSSP